MRQNKKMLYNKNKRENMSRAEALELFNHFSGSLDCEIDYKKEREEWRNKKMNALIINCSPVKNGATAEIVRIVEECIKQKYDTSSVCIDDYKFNFCKGCRSCHTSAKCVQHDDFDLLITEFEKADIIVSVSPSYWADVPGQFKAFIDRCTPWCNTHQPHASLPKGKKGYSIVLRTGPNMKECERLISTIEHFYGHMEIESVDRIGFCSIEFKEAVNGIKNEIIEFCKKI